MPVPASSSREQRYDYIIAGAGCAGLSLAVHLILSGQFSNKKILLIERKEQKTNDRTWCFWETEPGLFDTIVYKKWEKAWFRGDQFSRLLPLDPYQYKLIRGIEFYEYCFELIRKQPNFEIRYCDIREIKNENGKSWVNTGKEFFFAGYIFNSILFAKPVLQKKETYLLQHFKGWVIETIKAVFDPQEATLMDFNVSQHHGTTFVYVMPFSEKKALVEYTLFTESLLTPQQYEEGLKEYIAGIPGIDSYTVGEEEFGVIPMTSHKFPAWQGNIIHIGTAGGQTKASTGYTFRSIQKHSELIVMQLAKEGHPFLKPLKGARRFGFYDSVLLHILQQHKLPGRQIFTDLFKKNKPRQVLRFLDNESSLKEEIKIISSLPAWPFLKAALKQL